MPTLSEYAKLSNDPVESAIFDAIITEDMLTAALMFEPMEGNSLVYNRENALPASATHAVGDTWEDSEATYTKKTASLTIVGVQSPLDRFAIATRSNVMDQRAVVRIGMAKSLSRKIAGLVITGEPESVTTEFEGLDSLCRAETRMMAMDDGNIDGPGTAETELTQDRLDAMIDMVEGGLPDALVMNKTMRRKLTALSRVAGSGVVMGNIEMFGHKVRTYDEIPILINDFVTNAEVYNDSGTWPSSTATTIFALKFGKEKQGYTLLHNGPVMTPDFQDLGIKEKKNEELYRMVAYLQGITYSAKYIAALGGIDSAA